jgi:hypothetical protein
MDPSCDVVASGALGASDGQGSRHGYQLPVRLVARYARQEPMCVHAPS